MPGLKKGEQDLKSINLKGLLCLKKNEICQMGAAKICLQLNDTVSFPIFYFILKIK